MDIASHLTPEERRILASLGFVNIDTTDEQPSATAAATAEPVTDETDSYPQHWLPGRHNASEDAAAAVTAYVSQLRSGAMPADHETTPDYPANWL